MMPRQYRRPPLSDHAKDAYHRVHFAWAKQEYSDHLTDVYGYCQEIRIPFIAIIQPRRYCTLELDMSPSGIEMTLPEQKQVRDLAQTALDMSGAPKKSKSLHVLPGACVVSGLEIEDAKQLASQLWKCISGGVI